VQTGRDESSLKLGDLPKYSAAKLTMAEIISPTIIDIGLLIIYSILSFAASFFVFRKYDLR
jgi:hypothetical protein